MEKVEIYIKKEDLNKSINDLIKEKNITDVPYSITISVELMKASDLIWNFHEKTKEEFVNDILDLAKPTEKFDTYFDRVIKYQKLWADFITKENLGELYDKYISINQIEDLEDCYIIQEE